MRGFLTKTDVLRKPNRKVRGKGSAGKLKRTRQLKTNGLQLLITQQMKDSFRQGFCKRSGIGVFALVTNCLDKRLVLCKQYSSSPRFKKAMAGITTKSTHRGDMKYNRLGLIAAMALGSLVAFANMASAQDAKEGKGKRGMPTVQEQMDRLNEELKLTDDQKPKVKAVLEETSKKRQELRDLPQDERREKARGLRDEQNKKMKEILTADQYSKYEKMTPPGRGGPGGAPPEKKD
jgi:Spy/CpxP family protein refolding chaperone